MKKDNLWLWIALGTVVIIAFNVFFFALSADNKPASVWVNYVFITFSYIVLMLGDMCANINLPEPMEQHRRSGAQITAICTDKAADGCDRIKISVTNSGQSYNREPKRVRQGRNGCSRLYPLTERQKNKK